MTDTTEKDKTRFLLYVEKKDDGCWCWRGSKAISGYCNFFYKGKTWLAHRASLLIFGKTKALTEGLVVSHVCRERSCVNPEHLAEKTVKENNGSDKRRDGTDQSGDRCHFSKLDWEKVKQIRESDEPRKDLAAKFGVTVSCVSAIMRNKTWVEKPE